MSQDSRKRRLSENQAVFRKLNESVQKSFEITKQIAEQEGVDNLAFRGDISLHFFCECSDEKCQKRITLTLDRYNKIHKKRDRFVVAHGHEIKDIERIIRKEGDYSIVEKFKKPQESPPTIHKTNAHNERKAR
jgi:hypothetical protein